MCGHRHNRARAVAHHNIVRNINRDFFAVDGIDRRQSVQFHAGFVFDQLRALKFGLFRAFGAIVFDRVHIGNTVLVFVNQRVFGRHNHKGHAEQCVGAGGVNPQGFGHIFQGEIHKCAAGFPDPIHLLLLYIRQVIHRFQAFEQFIGVFGDAQIPNIFGFLHHIAVANIALAALRVLIGQHHLAGRAVVDKRFVAERKPVFKHFQENPLRPLIIALFGGVNHTRPVERKADFF